MPGYGIPKSEDGLLRWTWAAKRLEQAHTYWLATTRSDGKPHAMPVWCVWMDGKLFFSTGRRSRKARNLARDAHCVVCMERNRESVIVEGVARRMTGAPLARRVVTAYNRKYSSPIPAGEPIYAIEPRVVFGFIERLNDFPRTATRWTFS